MKGFNDVHKELTDQGYNPKFIGSFTRKNPYGRKFFSDGKYIEETYEIEEKPEYQIGVKVTGRNEIKLYNKEKETILTATSQRQFIEKLKEKGIIKRKGR